jgi:DNA repair photolyase
MDVKINAPNLLQRQITKKKVGRVWISGVCDAYQPLEKRYEVTKKCLEILLKQDWPVTVQTKSPLALRDLELFKQFRDIEVGLTITTGDEQIKKIFEPNSPPIEKRIKALETLHSNGVKTYAMIAPLLPKAEKLATHLKGKVDYVLVDKMNYHYADWVYRRHNLEQVLTTNFFTQKKEKLVEAFKEMGISHQILF